MFLFIYSEFFMFIGMQLVCWLLLSFFLPCIKIILFLNWLIMVNNLQKVLPTLEYCLPSDKSSPVAAIHLLTTDNFLGTLNPSQQPLFSGKTTLEPLMGPALP